MKELLLLMTLFSFVTSSWAQRKTQIVEPVSQSVTQTGKIFKRKVAISRFSNETQYAKGIFYDKENDPMGKQALDILSAKLAASGKFMLLERNDLASLLEEAKKSENGSAAIGADYLIIGSVILSRFSNNSLIENDAGFKLIFPLSTLEISKISLINVNK